MPLQSAIVCPRTESLEAPCVARDGHTALADDNLCVMCRERPDEVLRDLGNRYPPAAEAWLALWGSEPSRMANAARVNVRAYVATLRDKEPAGD